MRLRALPSQPGSILSRYLEDTLTGPSANKVSNVRRQFRRRILNPSSLAIAQAVSRLRP